MNKKVVLFVLVLLIVPVVYSQGFLSTPEQECSADNIKGDANGDGVISQADMDVMIQLVSGIDATCNNTEECNIDCIDVMDMDNDGLYGPTDMTKVNDLLPKPPPVIVNNQPKTCDDCGRGIFRVCRQRACESIPGCEFESSLLGLWGSCNEISQESGSQNIVGISAGGAQSHTCVLFGDGSARCWGDNKYGQLGLGSTYTGDKYILPKNVDLSGIASISSAYLHTCAVLNTGKVSCWGSNMHGSIGSPTISKSYSPLEVPEIEDVIQVGGGLFHTCVLKNDGTVMCWGDNKYGQLADATTNQNSYVPLQIPHVENAVQLSVGNNYACARIDDGTVKCWGDNRGGMMGVSGPTWSPAIQISNINNAIDLATGNTHVCALLDTKKVKCWGTYTYGQLGLGNDIRSNGWPAPSDEVIEVNNAIQVDSGKLFSCALIDDDGDLTDGGPVKCWGINRYGSTGTGILQSEIHTPQNVDGINDAIMISVGGEHACAVLSDQKTMMCWGYNEFGEIGDGTTIDKYTPFPVRGLTDCEGLSTGDHKCIANRHYICVDDYFMLEANGDCEAQNKPCDDTQGCGAELSKSNLVLYYDFNEDKQSVNDLSGNLNNATKQGDVSWCPNCGVDGGSGAYDFTGTIEYLLVPDSPSLDVTNQVTVSAWMKPEGPNPDIEIINTNLSSVGFPDSQTKWADVIKVSEGVYAIEYPCVPAGQSSYKGCLRTVRVEPDGSVTAIDGWAFTEAWRPTNYPKMIHISDDIYGVIYDGIRMHIFKINTDGTIVKSVIDYKTISSNGQFADIEHIVDDIYVVTYRRSLTSNIGGFIRTININNSGITNTELDLLEYSYANYYISTIEKLSDDTVAVFYMGKYRSDEGMHWHDSHVNTFRIDADGNITELNHLEFDNWKSDLDDACLYPSVAKVVEGIYAVACNMEYHNGRQIEIWTLNITSDGTINGVVGHEVLDSPKTYHHDITNIGGGVFAVAYRDGDRGEPGVIELVQISNEGSITKDSSSKKIFAPTLNTLDQLHPNMIMINEETLGIAYGNILNKETFQTMKIRIPGKGVFKSDAYRIGAGQDSAFGKTNNNKITTSISPEWKHIAFTYNSGVQKLYIDGIEQASGTGSVPIRLNNNALVVGENFNGKIDEVMIFNRALNPIEVKGLYQSKKN